MAKRELMGSPEALERELAEVVSRIERLKRERKLFGRLGFSAEQMKLELSQLEKRREKYEDALRSWREDGERMVLRGYPQVEG